MTWDLPTALHAELGGDPGPWHRHLKTAWRGSITKTSDVNLPKNPSLGHAPSQSAVEHAKVISYWSPMFQPLIFGLGWSRPDLGLLRWREDGLPTEDPILRAVRRWWGEDGITDVLAWAQARDGFDELIARNGNSSDALSPHPGFPASPCSKDLERRRQSDDWKAVWGGGGDPHHLLHHAQVATHFEHPFEPRRFDGYDGSTLLLEKYEGWYQALIDLFQDEKAQVDVVVKPIGWLGTFTQSPNTGLWHRTEEHTHLMGASA